jgi:hypothetical protein
MFVPKYVQVYLQMIPGVLYYTSLVPNGSLSMIELINNTLGGYSWSGGVDSLMRPLLKRGMVSMTKAGPSRNSPVCYMRIPDIGDKNV